MVLRDLNINKFFELVFQYIPKDILHNIGFLLRNSRKRLDLKRIRITQHCIYVKKTCFLYLVMNWCLQFIMIFFSLYTCSCCCVSTICFFFKHFSANVFGFPSPIFFELANCTSSTLPNPPTPKVARISKSFSRRPSNSNQNNKIHRKKFIFMTL